MAARADPPNLNSLQAMSSRLPGVVRSRHWWWLILLLWTLVVGASFYSQVVAVRRHGMELLQSSAREIFNIVVLARRWNANHGGVYVPVTEQFRPNPYLEVPWRDVVTREGKPLTLVNPAFMTRLIGDLAERKDGVKLHITSLDPIRPGNTPDAREAEALHAFEEGAEERSWFENTVEGARMFRYMAPLWVEKPCLRCHRDQGYELGDLRGGISVTFNDDRAVMAETTRIKEIAILHLSVYLLVAVLGWRLLEQLRWRWLRLDRDVVEVRTAQEQILRDEKMASLGRVVAGFAHEISTPIGVALGALSSSNLTLERIDALLTTEEVSEDDLRRELGRLKSGESMAQANLTRAVNLIQSFKRTSIDQSSDMQRVYDMKELLEDVLHMLHNHLKRLPIKVNTRCPERLRIDGVPGQIQQLLTNLIMNSLVHGFQDGTRDGEIGIEVSLPTPGRVRIDYTDDGVGMTPEVCEHAFDSYYTTRRESGGSGLGLFICHDIVVNTLRGSIACDSAPGAGTRFAVEFPANVVTERGSR